ncbi:hypothetical protein BDQ17DRAFT_91448 [Cyathus striatus]|nr:hypothetical protein BDQ17DRAFT_91448 [Cyathus striatus]
MPAVKVASPPPAVKRVVRFADSDDDEDDGTPLYILRAKKKREEKAKFLRREQLLRMAEQDKERRAREEEERRQNEEFMERERKRLAREQEKKERDRRLYADEVAAARLRRESFRAGMVSNASSTLIPSSSSSASLGDTESNRLRDSTKRQSHAPQLSRKEVSDTALPTISTSHSYLHPQGSSSGGSRPPSGAYSPASVSHSRPPSTYSHSSDEVRQIGVVGASSKRNSLAASVSGSYRPAPERSWTMPNWGGSTQSLHVVPPVPPVPDYLSMPLLPPTAPFMMMQYPKRQSSPSPGSSSGSRRGGSANSSSERVNHHYQQAHPQQRQHSQSPHHSSSPHRPAHERRSSDDSRRSSIPPIPSQGSQSTRSRSRSSTVQPSPRGRMTHPMQQQQQQPNPWTALPSQLGRPPVAMPVSSYSHGNMGTPRSTSGGTNRGTLRQSMHS